MGALKGGRWVVFVAVAAGLLSLAAGCGRGGGPTDPVAGPTDPVAVAQGVVPVAPPAYLDGYFATVRSAEGWQPGWTVVVVPSWAEDPTRAAAVVAERRVFVLVSLHHCWGGGSLEEGCYRRTRAWAEPLVRTGRVVGWYAVDEPLHNGVREGAVMAGVARVRADGGRVMVAETYAMYAKTLRVEGRRLDYGADWFGLTAYGVVPGWVADRYREDARLNVAFVSSSEGDPGLGRAGCLRWSLDMGAAGHGLPRRLP